MITPHNDSKGKNTNPNIKRHDLPIKKIRVEGKLRNVIVEVGNDLYYLYQGNHINTEEPLTQTDLLADMNKEGGGLSPENNERVPYEERGPLALQYMEQEQPESYGGKRKKQSGGRVTMPIQYFGGELNRYFPAGSPELNPLPSAYGTTIARSFGTYDPRLLQLNAVAPNLGPMGLGSYGENMSYGVQTGGDIDRKRKRSPTGSPTESPTKKKPKPNSASQTKKRPRTNSAAASPKKKPKSSTDDDTDV